MKQRPSRMLPHAGGFVSIYLVLGFSVLSITSTLHALSSGSGQGRGKKRKRNFFRLLQASRLIKSYFSLSLSLSLVTWFHFNWQHAISAVLLRFLFSFETLPIICRNYGSKFDNIAVIIVVHYGTTALSLT